MHFGLTNIIDKSLFLGYYEVVLTDENGTQLVPEYSLYTNVEIQWEVKQNVSCKLDNLEISWAFKANTIWFNF